jgi:2-oxoisovalerate dehydrogenase E1 component beta subunit
MLMGKHVPGIGMQETYEDNSVPQFPDVIDAMREIAADAA